MQANIGACWVGKTEVLASEERQEVRIDLENVIEAEVEFIVVDTLGTPVPGAVALWQSADVGCVPEGDFEIGDDGRMVQSIGVGEHTVFVEVPNAKIHRETVDLVAGERAVVEVVIEPTKVRVESLEIVILDMVHFETASAVIRPISYPLLNEVGTTIMRYERIKKVEVAGHTDDRGTPSYNLDLSQRRAQAVLEYLVAQGVSRSRFIATGYGESLPIEGNDSEEGRYQNRRVAFTILEQADE
jgi:outer membrane protein OmpA-like peptidoglycan-associated protein